MFDRTKENPDEVVPYDSSLDADVDSDDEEDSVESRRAKHIQISLNSAELMIVDADIRAIESIPDIVMDPRLWNK